MERTSLFVGRPLPYARPEHALAAVEVARDPSRLDHHLARLVACEDVSHVYGALVDLFIGLPAAEVAGRRSALERFGGVLDEEELLALEAAVDSGLSDTDLIPPTSHSLLSAGISGSPVIERPAPPVANVPLDLAEGPAALAPGNLPVPRPSSTPATPRSDGGRARRWGLVGVVALVLVLLGLRRRRAR